MADGKALIASAITGKGISTTADAAFATMANNIKSISSTQIGYVSGSGSYYVNSDDNADRTFSPTFSVALPSVANKTIKGVFLSDCTTNLSSDGRIATRNRRVYVSSWNQNTAVITHTFHWECRYKGTMSCSVQLAVVYG